MPTPRPLFSPQRRAYPRRIAAVALFLAAQAASLPAAELTLGEGVVVKFGGDAQLVVRDKLGMGQGVLLTSLKDDSAGGQALPTAQTPAAGDWRGLRIEKSAAGYGVSNFNDVTVRHAGAQDVAGNTAALYLRGLSPNLQNLVLADSITGLRLTGGAAPTITGASFLRNQTGVLVEDGAAPRITGSQFVGNSVLAIRNLTPSTLFQATGGWWGVASGPRDPVANPAGQGDAVSTGVNYAGYLTAAPLLAPSIRLAAPAAYFEDSAVRLEIGCVNATEYRIAENDGFVGVPFLPLTGERIQVAYNVSAGDGRKALSVRFRNASGAVAGATLVGGALIDTQSPSLSLTTPSPGSVVSAPITVEAQAWDGSGIARVEFYLNETLVGSDTTAPYTYAWNTDAHAEGLHTWRVVAYDLAGRSVSRSSQVTLARAVPPADTEGPLLASVKFNGAALAGGATLTRSGSVTLTASDRSGVSRVELLLDEVVVAGFSGSGNYSATLDLENVADGAHTLAIRASDSLNNRTLQSYAVTVSHAVPDAPVVSQPGNGLYTASASVAVAGTAKAGSSVQLLLNGQVVGSALAVGSDGRFSTTLALNPGSNRIQAVATDRYGSSPASSVVTVTLDTSIPSAPTNLAASSQESGRIRLAWTRSSDPNTTGYHLYRATTGFSTLAEAQKINASLITGNTYDDLPPQDGTWYYRVVAVNAVGTASSPTNQAQSLSDSVAPRALSIVYSPQGRVDAATGRIGQGRVNLVLSSSEALPTAPYLSIVPQGGTPIPVELSGSGATFSGSFLVDAYTPSGVANALFSARDAVGNRGTAIDVGATLNIDTAGPALSGIHLDPAAPIRNDGSPAIQATFTFTKALKAGSTPQVSALLSGPLRSPIALSGLVQTGPTTWQAVFHLPADTGLAGPENLSFSFQAMDDLDNVSTRVLAANRFQVYLGSLPPLDVPLGLTARAQPGGQVRLSWVAVDLAAAYQLYRQGPGDSALVELARALGTEYLDQTPLDGTYRYAVATVRQSNGQESLSGQSAVVDVVASATAPGAPTGLALSLTGQGIVATWQPPLASSVASYKLYRAAGTVITDITGLTPLKSGVPRPVALDAAPSPLQGAYAVTAQDAAGNESALSNSAYLNASLLPVTNLKVSQIGKTLPVISWNAPNGNVAGYLAYIGTAPNRIKLTANPMTGTSLTDTGYTSGERLYTIASVDANGVEMPRSILLPAISSQIVSGLPLRRGIMNRLQLQVSNTSATTLGNIQAVVRLPIDRDATQFRDHQSEAFTLAPNETRLVSVVVGGYDGLPDAPLARIGVQLSANEGEQVEVAQNQTLEVGDGALVVSMATESFTRGGTGKLRLTVENTSDVDVELLTAANNSDSSELRFKLLDQDGNVLATQAYKQLFGANVITLGNGQTVARILAGSRYVSDEFSLNVPLSSPNGIRVRLEVDKLRYHTGQTDEVVIAGRGSEKTVWLMDTAYLGEITDITPITSYGDQNVVITGRSLDRQTNQPVAYSRLNLVLDQQGFERVTSVLTDAGGHFSHTFTPTPSDGGLYQVSAIHPDITDRPRQRAFTLNRVTFGPTPYRLDVPKNYPYTIPFTAKAGPGTAASNVHFQIDGGTAPEGIDLQLPSAVNLAERQTQNLPVVFSANNSAQPSGYVILNAHSAEHPATPIGQVRIDYRLSEARPHLTSTPSHVEAGLAQGETRVESVTVRNQGLQDALNLAFSLAKPDGSPAPAWLGIASQAGGTLAVGASRSVDLSFSPPAGTAEGVYEYRLSVQGDNVPAQTLNVYVSVTQSGQGSVLFKAADLYTATVDKTGRLIPGLSGASITLQNEDVATITRELATDGYGEALFRDLPAGSYKFRARAANHQEVGGRLLIKPGVTAYQSIFLDYNLITVEWSVREVTLQDRYEIVLNATYETDVPAAVVALQPASINLPKMNSGSVYYGELSLINHGLIRADNVQRNLPRSDSYFLYEFLADVPATLEPKQRVTIPYRVTAIKSLEDAVASGTASGGGCYSYSNTLNVTCDYVCSNGSKSNCGASTSWFSASNSTCPSGGGGGSSGASGGASGGGWGGFGGGSASTPVKLKGRKCVYVPRGDGPVCH